MVLLNDCVIFWALHPLAERENFARSCDVKFVVFKYIDDIFMVKPICFIQIELELTCITFFFTVACVNR